MQFKHPELLYALVLLLIPILIHLFQLRRFQKIDFTNVAFLKKVTIQTRKSSQLKKWLTLLARLLALACLIIAFAQPFSANSTATNSEQETVIYIDNSFSMEAKGANGPLLKRALQQLFEVSNGSEKISWFTNDMARKNVAQSDFKNDVLSLPYSQKQLSLDEVLLQGDQLFSKNETARKRLVVISDFQLMGAFPKKKEDLIIDAVEMRPVTLNNLAIDTAYISNKNSSTTQLQVEVTKQGDAPNTAVSLFNGNTLIAKTGLDFSENAKNKLTFDIENVDYFKGNISLTDANLQFDNSLYFSINSAKKIKVLSVSEVSASFLQRLFDNETYLYKQQSFGELNYNDIPNQNFIILNELKTIPASLVTSLTSFSKGGGSIFIIPAKNIDVGSYNNLVSVLGLGNFNSLNSQEKKITKINFSHPLYRDVFEKQISNFQYPKVNSYYRTASNATKLLSFEDSSPFLLQGGRNFMSTASFSSENSNFKNSPLIVPTLINMAQQSLPLPNLYYNIGNNNSYAVILKLNQDEILTINDSLQSFIPLQQTKANSVEITTTDQPSASGNYDLRRTDQFIEGISYNYPRTESILQYANLEDWEGVNTYSSISNLFQSIAEENKINSFWKWFIIFAVLFLLAEMLLLKFLKN